MLKKFLKFKLSQLSYIHFIIIFVSITGLALLIGYYYGYQDSKIKNYSYFLNYFQNGQKASSVINQPVYSLSGTIDKIMDNKIYFHSAVFTNNGEKNYTINRVAKINANTAIIQMTEKNPDQQKKEVTQYNQKNKNLKAGEKPGPFPTPYNENKIALTDLINGQQINIYSDEDINANNEFNASKVQVPITIPGQLFKTPDGLPGNGTSIAPPK